MTDFRLLNDKQMKLLEKTVILYKLTIISKLSKRFSAVIELYLDISCAKKKLMGSQNDKTAKIRRSVETSLKSVPIRFFKTTMVIRNNPGKTLTGEIYLRVRRDIQCNLTRFIKLGS